MLPSEKQYIEVPLPMSCSFLYKLWTRLKGILLSPFYLMLSRIKGVPGISFYLRCIATGINLLFRGRISLNTGYNLIFNPMDSTRYFEFHEVWNSLENLNFKRLLDVSSPRLMPLLILKATPEAKAFLINPDSSDLQETKQLANALNLQSHCEFSDVTLEEAGFAPCSFDLITSISVLEHIPQDKIVVETMWSLLRPGGKLILTLPCMAQPLTQYISHNQYGVIEAGDDGYTFWQRYYNHERLESSIYSITGRPTRTVVYGEKKYGLFFRNASMKRLLGHRYPFWREPYIMATEYQSFNSTNDLPGEGVIMLEFIKPCENK